MTTVPLAAARANLSKIIDEAVRTHDRVDITRNGLPAAVLLARDDYESMLATLEVLADQDLMADIAMASNDPHRHSQADLDEAMRASGRLADG